jgi:demethylmenaquinone methyltransferase/2-methoxy-6-polyprenyl-1,4-benzoquinol methylase
MPMKDNQPDMADFGFRQVAEDEKQTLVNEVFAKAAQRYDQMNDLMSGGLHRLWKDDIAFRIARTGGPGTCVTVADISPEMIAEGRNRAEHEGLTQRCQFTAGNAERLAFPDKSFDAYTIAFGIRNVTHIDQALTEAYRVLKHGGRFLCLEFSHADFPGLSQIYDAYSFTAIPAIGKMVTGDGKPYRYLVESIRKFPDPERFKSMIAAAGFSRVEVRCLMGGIVAMHSGWRI